MGGTITFNWKQVDKLLKDARRAWKTEPPKTLYGEATGRGFWLVGDDGIYLMHNGRTHVRKSGKVVDGEHGDSLLVVYCREANPERDPDGCWDAKRRYFGGDDGVNFLPLESVEKWLIWNKGKTNCPMHLTASSVELHGPQPAGTI